ncbi:MAG TPA: tRNA lysidine(34) synthetase TilS [Candidatus Acidoferrum sp.]|nr:tRNA lysidine(34) synthetase TilS [Candidatus Acidoferrum sp.]
MASRSKLIASLLVHAQKSELLRPGDRIGVAVSGGSDSVALMMLLLELREKLGIILSVVHFNHKLRGKASDADERFVAKLAAKHKLEFRSASADVAARAKKERENLEDVARRARYEFFKSLVEDDRMDRVAVAHTADDQAETVLDHILRGAGLPGLGGIYADRYPLIRPLLNMRRAELRAYLKARKQPWREDMTNKDTSRMRARVRRKLLPLLEKQFNSNAVAHLGNLAELARRDDAFLSALARMRCEALAQKETNASRITIANLLRPLAGTLFNVENTEFEGKPLRHAISSRMVRWLAKTARTRRGELSARHVDSVMDLALSGQNGSSLMLPGGVEVRKDRDSILFRAAQKSGSNTAHTRKHIFAYDIDLSDGTLNVNVPELGCVFHFRVIDWPSAGEEDNKREMVLDRERLRTALVLRNWRPGDRLRPSGHQNAHKLKRLLNEKHISRWEREGWPVLTSGETLVWARGFPVAAGFAANEKTRTGIVIAEEKI